MRHNFVTIADLNKDEIMYLIQMAAEFEKHPNRELLKGKIVATLFLNPQHAHVSVLRQLPTGWEPRL